MLSTPFGKLLVFGLLFGVMANIGRAVDQSPVAKQEAVSARRNEVQELKQKLEATESPEAKRVIVEQYRAKMELAMAQRVSQPQAPVKASQELVAELKLRAGNDPAMQKRVADLEQRSTSIEKLKEKLAEIGAADVDEKREVIEEFRTEQQKLAQQRDQEMAARQAQESAPPQNLPPAMQAIRAKAEERKQEIETLKAALEQAQPQERVELIDAFRAEQNRGAVTQP